MDIPLAARPAIPARHPLRATGVAAGLVALALALVYGVGMLFAPYTTVTARIGYLDDANALLLNTTAAIVTVFLMPVCLAAGFWLALLRLGQDSWRRVWVAVGALNVALLIATGALFGAIFYIGAEVSPPTIIGQYAPLLGAKWYLHALIQLPFFALFALILAAGCAWLSVCAGSLFTRWSQFQENTLRSLPRDLAITLLGSSFVALDYAAVFPVASRIVNHYTTYAPDVSPAMGLARLFLITIAPPALIAGFGAWQGWQRLTQGELRDEPPAATRPVPPSDDDVLFSYSSIED